MRKIFGVCIVLALVGAMVIGEEWNMHTVKGTAGDRTFDLVWKGPYLVEGNMDPGGFAKLAGGMADYRWDFSEDFSKIHVTVKTKVKTLEFDWLRKGDTATYSGVCHGWFMVGDKTTTITFYPDKISGNTDGDKLEFHISPPLTKEELPAGFPDIWRE